MTSFQLNSTIKMGFCEHRAVKMITEFDDARAEKLENQTFTAQIVFNFFFFTKR